MTLVDGGGKRLRPGRGAGTVMWEKKVCHRAGKCTYAQSSEHQPKRRGPAVRWTTVAGSLATSVIVSLGVGVPPAHAKNGDTHVVGQGVEQTLDCNDATLIVNGTNNTVNAMGNCWAVTVMGSGNTVIADSVTHDITVYGYNQTVFYHNGAPILWDRGRELGMTNRLQQVPA
jgi:Protein of unknown function (DUF3060)